MGKVKTKRVQRSLAGKALGAFKGLKDKNKTVAHFGE